MNLANIQRFLLSSAEFRLRHVTITITYRLWDSLAGGKIDIMVDS
jgi:hypothetical protein